MKKICYFCDNHIAAIDYKDTYLLRRFMNAQGKIYPPRRHGTCASHQRELGKAIKLSRTMGLLPFTVSQ